MGKCSIVCCITCSSSVDMWQVFVAIVPSWADLSGWSHCGSLALFQVSTRVLKEGRKAQLKLRFRHVTGLGHHWRVTEVLLHRVTHVAFV